MFDEKNLTENPEKIKPIIGITGEDFFQLVEDAEEKYPEYRNKSLQRENRQRAVGGGCKPRVALMLRIFALLLYLRLHVPQRTVSAMVDQISQSRVSRDLRSLLPLLQEILPVPEVWEILPEDENVSEEQKLSKTDFSGGQALIDAQEQAVNRPKDNEKQKKYYSGKKKKHTMKSQLVGGIDHQIKAISTSVPGSKHDKKLSDEVKTVQRLPDDIDAIADKGYQGMEKEVEKKKSISPKKINR